MCKEGVSCAGELTVPAEEVKYSRKFKGMLHVKVELQFTIN